MPRPVNIVSSARIAREEFVQFLQAVGGETGDPDGVYDGYLYKNEGVVWLMYNPEEDLTPEELESTISKIMQKLGSSPHTYILLALGKNLESEVLAAEFVRKFSQIRPGVVDSLRKKVYFVQEFIELCGTRQSF